MVGLSLSIQCRDFSGKCEVCFGFTYLILVCLYMCVCVCVFVCFSLCVFLSVCFSLCVSLFVFLCVCVCVCVCVLLLSFLLCVKEEIDVFEFVNCLVLYLGWLGAGGCAIE